jgi:tocopherol O-methyltransferase
MDSYHENDLSMQDDVRNYYDKNTERFLRFGGGGKIGAIHRKVWAKGVKTKTDALLYVNRRILEILHGLYPSHKKEKRVLDVGCGVGGTALWLAQHANLSTIGISNSQRQIDIARRRASHDRLNKRCAFFRMDYHSIHTLGLFDAAVAVESFAHAKNPAQFFSSVSSALVEGGVFIVFDDFLTVCGKAAGKDSQSPSKALQWIDRVKKGWHLTSLVGVEEAVECAEAAGLLLRKNEDLTAFLRQFPFVFLELLKLIARLPLRFPFFENLSGGTALQHSIKKGWVQYRSLILIKKKD